MADVKRIGETIEVTFHTIPNQTLTITGRNWCFDRFESYICDLNGSSITVNQDGTCQFCI
jgi:hypothetical protein